MNINYEWKIVNVIKKQQVENMSNVIIRVVYEYKGTDQDSGQSYTMLGGLDLDPPTSTNFTQIKNITKDQMISWLDSHRDILKIRKNIESCIQSQINNSDVSNASEISWLPQETVVIEPEVNIEQA